MKRTMIALTLALFALPAFGHDEGHGPKLTDAGKMGGVMASVIDAKETSKGAKAQMVYKAELVRSSDGTVRVYLYTTEMKPLDLAGFDKQVKAILESGHGKKMTKTPFELSVDGASFTGKAPKAARRPFNIDVTIKEGGRELLAAFDNLD